MRRYHGRRAPSDGLGEEPSRDGARRGVEIRLGLVEEEELGLSGEGLGDEDPLALPAREFVERNVRTTSEARRGSTKAEGWN